MFEMQTYFEGRVRAEWGFGHPGVAALLLGCVLCLVWSVQVQCAPRRRVLWRCLGWGLFGAEAILWISIATTYSRGPMICMAAVGIGGWLTRGQLAGAGSITAFSLDLWRRICANGIWRLSLVVLTLWLTGLTGRLAPGFVREDRAVINRLATWKGGLAMLADAPWWGWDDPPGLVLAQWYGDTRAPLRLFDLTQAYLTIGNRCGVGVLVLVAAVMSATFSAGVATTARSSGVRRETMLCSTRVLALVASASLLSDYLLDGRVVVITSAAGVAIWAGVWTLGSKRAVGRVLCTSLLASACLVVVGAGAVRWAASRRNWQVSAEHGLFLLRNLAMPSSESVAIFPDRRILGIVHGPLIRDSFGLAGEIAVHSARSDRVVSADIVWAFGGRYVEIGAARVEGGRFIVVHPIGPPDNLRAQPDAVVIPEIDHSLGWNEQWMFWSKARGIPVFKTRDCGQFIGIGEIEAWREVKRAVEGGDAL